MRRPRHCHSVVPRLIVGAITVVSTTTSLPGQQNMSAPAAVTSVRVRGAELHYLDLGHGEPVVFVHGSLGDLETFRPQFDAFSARYRVIAYSRRFHPPNPQPPGELIYSAATHADDLAGLITELRLTRPRVVGLSYGAYTALIMALRHPDRIRALVLAEPPLLPFLKGVSGGASFVEDWERLVLEPAQRSFGKGDDEGGLRLFVGGLRGAGAFDQLPAERRAQLLRYTNALKLQLLTNRRLYFPTVTCTDLREIRTPSLLVGGDSSPPMFARILDELARCLPNPSRVVIPRSGHNMQVDNPGQFNEQVLTFLNGY